MKHYIDSDGLLWALEDDGSQDHLITEDMREATQAEIDAIQNPPKSAEQIRQELVRSAQAYMDQVAKERAYDGILSLCSYKDSAVPQFAAEAAAGIAFRDAVWQHCYVVLANVQSGQRSVPTPAELVAELPTIVWPIDA